ncbi:hypothetical protein T492DRAFT_858529 [Pavlovales sp. CCMP2436]|nr:hypothetical protein T492DRAFT_858529 [Pavlovales sp. CCMP2436]
MRLAARTAARSIGAARKSGNTCLLGRRLSESLAFNPAPPANGCAMSAVEAELDELQRRYRIMEGDRKAYAEEVQSLQPASD